MIRHRSFKHGWWYHYRMHQPKTEQLCRGKLAPMGEYLTGLLSSCPDEKFLSGPRSSSLRMSLSAAYVAASGHEVCHLAQRAGTRSRSSHTTVEVAMLEGDRKTIAVEVPLWLDPWEHSLVRPFGEPLTGHIDILRVEEGRVWVWDYKPRAAKEKYAATQTFAYALMLSMRTGIPLEAFRCGWFDEQDAFVFPPAEGSLLIPSGKGRRSAVGKKI